MKKSAIVIIILLIMIIAVTGYFLYSYYFTIEEIPPIVNEFCGLSTKASCTTDNDCKIGGCSSQICGGKDEDLISTCEFRDCYNSEKYNLNCMCAGGSCKWATGTL